jgi:hypothetical protein
LLYKKATNAAGAQINLAMHSTVQHATTQQRSDIKHACNQQTLLQGESEINDSCS